MGCTLGSSPSSSSLLFLPLTDTLSSSSSLLDRPLFFCFSGG